MKSSRKLIAAVVLCICALPCSATFADSSILQQVDQNPETSDLVTAFLESHKAKRFRLVTVDVQSLRETISAFEQPGREATCCVLKFRIFPDVEIALYTHRVHAEPMAAWHWTGIDSLAGDESVIASLTIDFGDRVTGSFNGLGSRIRIEPLDWHGTHIIWQSRPVEKRID